MEKINCSVGILTLNSELHLGETLASVTDFADVFILDGNSTDKTLEIARQYGAKIYQQFLSPEPNQKIADFAEMKNKLLARAGCNWFINLDSDEYLSADAREKVAAIVLQNKITEAYAFTEKQIIEGKVIKHSFSEKIHYLRLFNKKSGIIWNPKKKVHEKLLVPEGVKIINLSESFYHYSPDYITCLKKDRHYLSIAKEKILTKSKFYRHKAALVSVLKNLSLTLVIIWKSIIVYVRYGFRDSLPPNHVFRYVRYHVCIAYYRFLQIIKNI